MKSYIIKGVMTAAVVWALGSATAQTMDVLMDPAPEEWPTYGRNVDMWFYSPLDQINRDNVSDLRLAWSRTLGLDFEAQNSPVVYNGVMYINVPDGVIALDATNGDLVWQYTVELDENAGFLTSTRTRGSVLVFEGNVYQTLGDGRVVALDVETGEEAWSTQVGQIEFAEGFSTGPIFADGKIIVGPSGADPGGVAGRILALEAQSGEILWTFSTVPGPGEPGYETWDPPESAELGGGSAWNAGAYDPETRTVIYGVGQPIPWGRFDVRRNEGEPSADLYTASWVALDVDTGELKWYHQVVPADEWDLDQIATPTIIDLELDGQMRRVALLPTVTGFLVLIDVETGEFLRADALHPEYTVHTGYEADGTPIINSAARLEEPGDTTLVCPFRWVDFEPAAYSPQTGLYYRPNTYDCYEFTDYGHPEGWEPGEDPLDVELTPLPDRFERHGAISAIDPATGEVVWEFTHGYAQRSGPVATGGELVFMGSPDRVFRAFDAETGDVLWQQVLTAYIGANPITYAVDGRQYVAVPVGGLGGLVISRQSDVPPLVIGEVSVFVFALPE